MNLPKQTLDLFAETLRLAFVQRGKGRPFLLLHGGAGVGTMAGLAGALATKASIVLPIHPGFDGEPRPDRIARVSDLVLAYLTLLERLDLRDVIVVGNSIGGWIAAELALRKSPRLAGVVLLDAVGIDTGSPDRAIADPAKIPGPELFSMAFHDPTKFSVPASWGAPDDAATLEENGRALRVYAGDPYMHDPGLHARLTDITAPTLVAWGESDRLVDLDYGRRYASGIPCARFEVVARAGHLPHVERLDETRLLIEDFAAKL